MQALMNNPRRKRLLSSFAISRWAVFSRSYAPDPSTAARNDIDRRLPQAAAVKEGLSRTTCA